MVRSKAAVRKTESKPNAQSPMSPTVGAIKVLVNDIQIQKVGSSPSSTAPEKGRRRRGGTAFKVDINTGGQDSPKTLMFTEAESATQTATEDGGSEALL